MRAIYFLFFFIIFPNSLMATDEPEFRLILKEDKFEIREYVPKIIAQVEVFGGFDDEKIIAKNVKSFSIKTKKFSPPEIISISGTNFTKQLS